VTGLIDYSLYLITDRSFTGERDLLEVVAAAVRGGVTMVQLREKTVTAREVFARARSLRTLLEPAGIPLIINDRLDIAIAAACAGVHVGPQDMPVGVVRRAMGPDMLLGVSVHTAEDALEAEKAGADYISVSPVFYTSTKPNISSPVGLKGVKTISDAVSIPVVGIGGINGSNIADLIRAGARGGAVVSAIMADPNPEEAASRLILTVKKTTGER